MEQVIINLVENALYHGNKQNKDAPVIIAIGTTHDQNQVFIDVIDHGNGITSEGLEHLFEPFYTTELQGTGLGLYLSREICEANQAQLDYLEPEANYSKWQTPPSTKDILVNKLSQGRIFGACFRIMFAHDKRIL